jgi:Asp-tRNA(Asn)/Glu-tRNA(Gln) amidotransferase A subunit family amidase
MIDLHKLGARDAARRIEAGDFTAEAYVRACLGRIGGREGAVRAWRHLDARGAVAAARTAPTGPLKGLPVGVKDLMDTADMPTTYGSRIYPDHRPVADAACVARTRALGGVIMGKTVTTEFAWRNPGPTSNPHNPEHTPGGSSSGSAAAVADFHVPLAFGTQTAGSVIRPAAYCGCVGFKPSRGTHDRAGVKELSDYLDTVGTFARSVEDVAFFDFALRGEVMPALDGFDGSAPRLAVVVPFASAAELFAVDAIDTVARAAEAAGAVVIRGDEETGFETLADLQALIMTAESARALSREYEEHADLLIRFYREQIAIGNAVADDALARARDQADAAGTAMAALFDGVDAVLTLPAPGEAPKGLDFTGDPLFNKVWTLLGWPCVTIPCGFGPNGLPIGAQIVGPMGEDARTLAVAAWLESVING